MFPLNFISKKSDKKMKTESYNTHKSIVKAKNRKRNKIARKSRRLNQFKTSGKIRKFNSKAR